MQNSRKSKKNSKKSGNGWGNNSSLPNVAGFAWEQYYWMQDFLASMTEEERRQFIEDRMKYYGQV